MLELENAILELIESLFFWLDCNTPLYEKYTKQMKNRSMETTNQKETFKS